MKKIDNNTKQLKVFNLILVRQDNKVEQDTLFAAKMPTDKQVEEIGIRYSCNVIVHYIGDYIPLENAVKPLIYKLPKPEEVEK